jgi:hypothetical protein
MANLSSEGNTRYYLKETAISSSSQFIIFSGPPCGVNITRNFEREYK